MQDYGCHPIWYYPDRNGIPENGLPEEMLSDTELVALLRDISKEYHGLFINTKYEFSYRGFQSEEEHFLYLSKCFSAMAMIAKRYGDKYRIEFQLNWL